MRREAVHVVVSGRVQGVGYRYFAQETAYALGLSGWVQNLPDRTVEAYAEGDRASLEAWIVRLRQGPSSSRVEHIHLQWQDASELSSLFEIR